MGRKSIFIFVGLLCAGLSIGQEKAALNEAYLQYIAKYRKLAEEQEQLHKIPACITLAQGLLESGAGNSELAVKAKNHFGIKCHKDWEGATYSHDDETKDECFRKYTKVADSYEDHSKFLLRPRYASLFELPITDYKGWAHGLRRCGYATDPTYAAKLIHLIEDYGLAPDTTKSDGAEKTVIPLCPVGTSPTLGEESDKSDGAEKTVIPLCPVGTSPTLGEESDKSDVTEQKDQTDKKAAELKAEKEQKEAVRDAEKEQKAAERKAEQEQKAAQRKAEQEQRDAERQAKQEQREAQRKAEQEKRKAEKAEEELENQAESQQSDLVSKSFGKGQKVVGTMGVVSLYAQHTVHSNKMVRWVIAEPGDTYEEIGYEFNIEASRMLRYNNASKGDKPKPGDKVYLTRHK